MRRVACVAAIVMSAALVSAQRQAKTFDIYLVDVEGGNASHGDHYGGLAELTTRIPIRHFIDHGANIQPAEATDAFLNDALHVREVPRASRATRNST